MYTSVELLDLLAESKPLSYSGILKNYSRRRRVHLGDSYDYGANQALPTADYHLSPCSPNPPHRFPPSPRPSPPAPVRPSSTPRSSCRQYLDLPLYRPPRL